MMLHLLDTTIISWIFYVCSNKFEKQNRKYWDGLIQESLNESTCAPLKMFALCYYLLNAATVKKEESPSRAEQCFLSTLLSSPLQSHSLWKVCKVPLLKCYYPETEIVFKRKQRFFFQTPSYTSGSVKQRVTDAGLDACVSAITIL